MNNPSSHQVSESDDARRDMTLRQLVSAANKTLRTRADTELVDEGIDLMFDAGIIARCRRCRLSWRVSRSRFKQIEWWSCPGNCNRQP
jgi:hypothetical protein